ncbi:MAG: type II toxin-antitoxin system VapC family toxin [Anaerolineaceae bacterium]|nr:MAG: type II toxin-antitoxin system VapC family toxin [Anaerolineaceae bacterium]
MNGTSDWIISMIPNVQPTHIFDTTVFIHVLRNHSKVAERLITDAAIGKIVGGISVITSAELWTGICKRLDADQHNLIISPFQRIPITHELATRGGEIKCLAKKNGNDVSLPDCLIVATAENYNLTIVTSNEKHFLLLQSYANFKIRSYIP